MTLSINSNDLSDITENNPRQTIRKITSQIEVNYFAIIRRFV